MKKILIAAAIILTSAVTAMSVTKGDSKVAANVEKPATAKASLGANTDNLATID